jgi:hypothetical protein
MQTMKKIPFTYFYVTRIENGNYTDRGVDRSSGKKEVQVGLSKVLKLSVAENLLKI